MHTNDAWIALFRRIPANVQETLLIGLASGAEILIQKILKLDTEFMILRGRMAGTQDNRVMMLPYDKMVLIAVTQLLKDSEVDAIFGQGAPVAAAEMPVLPATAETPPPEERQTAASEPEPARPAAPTKATLVAKLREKLKEGGK